MSSFDTPIGPVRIVLDGGDAAHGARRPVDLRHAADLALIALSFGFVAAITFGALF